MTWLRQFLFKFRALFRRRKLEQEMAEEIALHVEERTRLNIEAGMDPDEARYAARRAFGGTDQIREQVRDESRWAWLEHLLQDTRFALRSLRTSPGFSCVAVLTLALGIGLSTALFSVIHSVLWAPVPYAKPHEMWRLAIVLRGTERELGYFSVRDYQAIAELPGVAQAMATTGEQMTLGGSEPTIVSGILVSGSAFEFLGVPPLLGRGITPGDVSGSGEAAPVAVLSYKMWQRTLAGDPGAVGKTILLNRRPYTIVGVMPPRFGWQEDDLFWLPMPTTNPGRGLEPIIRLHPGISRSVAEQQLQSVAQEMAAINPARYGSQFEAKLYGYLETTAASVNMGSSLRLLLFAAGFLLLISCTNVANLQLARGAGRSREIAIRLAIGASRQRVVRQLMTESIVLAAVASVVGLALAFGAAKLIVLQIPEYYVPNEARVTINGYMLGFGLLLSLVTAVLFGLAPAWECTRPDQNEALKDGGQGAGMGRRRRRTHNMLVVAEVALSIVLLAGASMAAIGFRQLLRFDPGFNPERLLLLQIPLSPDRYTNATQRNAFARDIIARIASVPGVESVGVGTLPAREGGLPFMIPGVSADQLDERVRTNAISANYFETIGLPLLAGRNLTEVDIERAQRVGVINEAAARLWPAGQDPVGRVIQIQLQGRQMADITVVGIAGNVRRPLEPLSPVPTVFLPYTVRTTAQRWLAIRTSIDPVGVVRDVQAQLRALDPEQPIGQWYTNDQIAGVWQARPRFNMAMLGSFAGIALALTGAGIYSVLSYQVSLRTREIGVRMALGATRNDILSLIVGGSYRLIVAGTLLGLVVSVMLAKIVSSQVLSMAGLSPLAPLVIASALIGCVGVFASFLPARRATLIEPILALRRE